MSNGDVMLTIHAEAQALKKAKAEGGKITHVLVLRFNKHGGFAMARPCQHCQDQLREAGVRERDVYYSDWVGSITRLEGDDS